MPTCSRGEIVRLGEVALYHCWSRCVRQAFLCGQDSVTGKNYEYRRAWIRDLEETLAGLFGIEIGFHGELSNHLHLVLRTRPDVVDNWSDHEVVERWLKISHLTKSRDGVAKPANPLRITMELAVPGRVQVLRRRLSDPSFLMAALCEHVARRSNREDECKGCFWEDRFKCRELLDERSLLVCGIYVDLNQIRAGEAATPEESTHTSAYDRIEDLQRGEPASHSSAGWMCELTIDERAAPNCEAHIRSSTSRRASDKGLLPISISDYLCLLDATGRTPRKGKAAIPSRIAPILERLGLQSDSWVELVDNYHTWFGHFVGSSRAVADRAQQSARKWYRGKSHCAAAFG